MGYRSEPIYVTKSFLPPRSEFDAYVDDIWQSGQLTNNGSLSEKFVNEVSKLLKIDASLFTLTGNGTQALQLTLRQIVGNDGGEIITTPFSYVATTSAILWEKFTPVFVDIEPKTLTIDPDKIEAAITPNTKAILGVHVFGNSCDVDRIEQIGNKYKLKVIYDAAHAFGVTHNSKPILEYGDASILSFHATKLMHTIEGGAVYTKSLQATERIELAKRFGHNGDEHIQLGINAKADEFKAAMGLANLKYIQDNIRKRGYKASLYDTLLSKNIQRQTARTGTNLNHSYFPIILKDEIQANSVIKALESRSIFPRRYFFPSLNELSYLKKRDNCPLSENISRRIICLPFYEDISEDTITEISEVINEATI